MTTRWLLNLALALLVAALAVFAWYRMQGQQQDARARLTDLTPAAVAEVRIERPKREALILARTDTGWRLQSPFAARANAFAVDNLLRLLQAPVEKTLPPNEPARYGLAPPTASLRFNDRAIEFGAMHPMQSWHYVRTNDQVHLIGSRYYAAVVAPVDNYLDTKLLEDGRQPTRFEFPSFRLVRAGDAWQRLPEDPNLSNDRINAFVEEWRQARALNVRRYSGRPVREQIRLGVGVDGRDTLTLGVLAREPELVLYRADEGLEYHFPPTTGRRLLELRDGGGS